MVRNISINFLYKRVGTRVETEKDSICLAVALASAESRKGGNPRIISLSRISFPFWIVQTSPTKSILLSASSGAKQQFQFSDIKGASEIRRIVSSDVSQAEDIPVAVSKIEPLLERVETSTRELANLMNPLSLVAVGKFIETTDPSAQPNRVEMQTDSRAALKRTEEFREISDAAKLRIEAMESLQNLVKEKLGGQMTILENLSTLERERWNERVKTMKERTEHEILELTKNKDDQLYNLRDKHRMDLRAMTADFSRLTNDLEQFYTQIVEEIREARTQISQKEVDVEGAISVYNALASNVRSNIGRSSQPLEVMDSKRDDLQSHVTVARKEYENEITKIEDSLKSLITDRENKIESTKSEMGQKMSELDDLNANVNNAVENTEQAIGSKIMKFQEEFLNLMSWTLDNDSISELAPLTLLDVGTYVAKYDSESFEILTPSFMPEEGVAGKLLSEEFSEILVSSIGNWMKSDPTFKDAFERACIKGNVFLDQEADTLFNEGLTALSRSNILQHADKERFETIWSRYAGKCPKCNTATEMGAKFCQKCGLDLS
ncbi:MAG: hypothetical protein RTV72_00945 [Candidatus Thorarchaeota archaeon]